jgi:glutathione S-transferase
MKLYTLPGSPTSRKVLALIHHLDLPVEIVAMPVEQVQSDEYAAINPNRFAPTLVDGDFILWESNAIGVYLAHDTLMFPTGLRPRADALRWLYWEAVQYNEALGTIFFESVVRPQLGLGEPNQALVDNGIVQARRYLPVLDAHLADKPFMLGDRLSFVDFAVAAAEPYRTRIPVDFDRHPHVQRFYESIARLPAWQKALGKPPVAVAA